MFRGVKGGMNRCRCTEDRFFVTELKVIKNINQQIDILIVVTRSKRVEVTLSKLYENKIRD